MVFVINLGPNFFRGEIKFPLLQGLVTINGHLKVTDGKVIDGVDVSSLHDNLVTLSDNQDIEAETVSKFFYS